MRVRGKLEPQLGRGPVGTGGDAADTRDEEDRAVAAFADIGACADPQHVVGRTAHRGDLGHVIAICKRQLRPVDGEHLTALLRELTTQRNEWRSASPLHFDRLQADVRGRTLDELDRQPV